MEQEKNKGGRPFKFTIEQLQNKINEYFEELETKPLYKYDVVKTGADAGKELKIKVKRMPSVQGLAVKIGISPREFYNWINADLLENNKELFHIAIHAKEEINRLQVEGAGAGLYQPAIVSRLQGLTDNQEITQTNIDATGKSEDEIRAAILAIKAARQKE